MGIKVILDLGNYTNAQLVSYYKEKIISKDELTRELEARGYDQNDIMMFFWSIGKKAA